MAKTMLGDYTGPFSRITSVLLCPSRKSPASPSNHPDHPTAAVYRLRVKLSHFVIEPCGSEHRRVRGKVQGIYVGENLILSSGAHESHR